MCFGHMRRRHSSHDSASPGAEASVRAARSLRAAQRAKRLDGRWSGGYFATGAEDLASPLFVFLKYLQRKLALAVLDLFYDAIEDLRSHPDSG